MKILLVLAVLFTYNMPIIIAKGGYDKNMEYFNWKSWHQQIILEEVIK